MENEIWKDIPEYEGVYQVSNFGRVKSLSREIWNGKGYLKSKEKIMLQANNGFNYLKVGLSKNNRHKFFHVHKLVAMAFLGHKPCGYKEVVDHINNDSLDNRLINLQLISNRENCSKDRKNKSSKFIGVSYYERGLYHSKIYHNEKQIHLGYFKTEIEASEYYQNALKAIENGDEIIRNVRINSSLFKGITFDSLYNKWACTYYDNITKKQKKIGRFKTEDEAYDARCKYLEKLNQ